LSYKLRLQVDDPERPGNLTDGLPPLPPNARYVYHRNECYDWGTAGWLLKDSGLVDSSKYKCAAKRAACERAQRQWARACTATLQQASCIKTAPTSWIQRLPGASAGTSS
jgi:hypothetical protein